MGELSRRELLAAGAAAGAALALEATAVAAQEPWLTSRTLFTELGDRSGWGRGWQTTGVANLRCAGGEGILEAGSDVFPNDPRPVAFAVDRRALDAEIAATITRPGTAPGVVLRRTSPRSYYAAIYDSGRGMLRLLRREDANLVELASVPVPTAQPPLRLMLEATGANPTSLRCALEDARGVRLSATARDSAAELQRSGDPGVLATAETLFPSGDNPVLPALGNLHLLPWGVQEGQAFMATDVGEALVAEIRRRSTAAFSEISVRAAAPGPSSAGVLAATTGPPRRTGAELHVASDLPARVTIELSYSPRLRKARRIDAGRTDGFQAITKTVRGMEPGRRVYWRARLKRRGRVTVGPIRSFRVPPAPGGDAVRVAVASCASQFGPIFGHLAGRRPDVLLWQGDLNYPDTHGPLAQSTSAYAGIWRDFLANPLLEPILGDAAFAPQRDDHDYGVQDANAALIREHPWGVAPWDSLMSRRLYYRFPAGAAEFWVLDQRTNKSDPEGEDGPGKTLLGERQRRWLFESMERSGAPFKLVCSPGTIFMGGNSRDGNWANRFEHERDELLRHIDERVSGTTIFLTGDRHLTGVLESDEGIEVRAAPLCIPTPNDTTLTDPNAAEEARAEPGVAYAGDEGHFTLLDVRGDTLDLSLIREDDEVVYERRFTASRAGHRRAR